MFDKGMRGGGILYLYNISFMKTVKLAIVDDNVNDVSRLKSLIEKYPFSLHKFSVDIDVFNRGINFIDPFNDVYDAVFLDIDMPIMNGLEAADKIREKNSKMEIVFVTNYASLAVNGYGVNALGFVVKPVKEEDVTKVLNKLLLKLLKDENEEKIVVKIKSGYQTIRVNEIKYIEVNIHDVYYHTSSGTIKTRGVLKEIEKQLNPKKFVKCSNCFLVNLDYIDSIEKDDVKIDGIKLKISRTRKKEFIEAFLANYN